MEAKGFHVRVEFGLEAFVVPGFTSLAVEIRFFVLVAHIPEFSTISFDFIPTFVIMSNDFKCSPSFADFNVILPTFQNS